MVIPLLRLPPSCPMGWASPLYVWKGRLMKWLGERNHEVRYQVAGERNRDQVRQVTTK